jgi:hypothetical protein
METAPSTYFGTPIRPWALLDDRAPYAVQHQGTIYVPPGVFDGIKTASEQELLNILSRLRLLRLPFTLSL